MSDAVKAFVQERNAVLLEGDLDKLAAFYAQHNPGLRPPPREVLEISMHKARTAALGLPQEVRDASKVWLEERGYSHFGDEQNAR